ncbi:unnamed protein product [Choristocarpus tenellus]
MTPRISLLLGGLFVALTQTFTDAWVNVADKTTVSATATAFDTRTLSNNGCDPSGCSPELTLDGDLDGSSRWSCSTDLGVDTCSITYTFESQQPVTALYIAFYKGTSRTRKFQIYDGHTIMLETESSGNTNGLEFFPFTNKGEVFMTDTITIISTPDDDDDEWFSLTEVEIMAVDGDEIGTTSNSVSVDATGYDDRTTSGCPNQCLPSNTRDGNNEDAGRWSCLNADATGGLCSITYEFDSPAYVYSMLVSFYKGDERVRRLKVYVNDDWVYSFTTSGVTSSWEEISLDTSVTTVKLEALGLGTDWLSITETMIFVVL